MSICVTRVVAFVEAGGGGANAPSRLAAIWAKWLCAEAARLFSVSEGSVHNWLKRDNLAPTKVKRRDRKLNWKALEQHIQDEPDAKLKDRAEYFGVHTTAISYAIKQMNITRKKTAKVSRAQSSHLDRSFFSNYDWSFNNREAKI